MPQRGGADQGHPDGPKDDPALRQDSHFSAAQTSQIRFSTTFDFQGLGLSCRLLSKALGWCCGFLTQALERCCWFLARALERCCWFLAQALGTWSPQQYALREVADEAVLSSARDEARNRRLSRAAPGMRPVTPAPPNAALFCAAESPAVARRRSMCTPLWPNSPRTGRQRRAVSGVERPGGPPGDVPGSPAVHRGTYL